MIKLKTYIFESSITGHAELTGRNATVYYLNHNQGRNPDLIRVFTELPSGPGIWFDMEDWHDILETTWHGFSSSPVDTSANSYSIRVYRQGHGQTPMNLKFKAYWF